MIGSDTSELADSERIEWIRLIPFILIHAVGLIGPFFVGVSAAAIVIAASLYVIRMFFVTGFIHRYFSHRTFEIVLWPRFTQWVMAFLSTTAVQKGVVWWASHHRHHHSKSDKQHEDVHSNFWDGFFWSHVGWIFCPKYRKLDEAKARDWMKYPEIMWFEKKHNHLVGPVLLACFCGFLGWYLGDAWKTSAIQIVVWGFFTSTVVLYHGTFAINSLAHMWGKRRYETDDKSKNSLLLAIVTLGEGWHNNHHHNQHRVAQAVTRFEYFFDVTYWILRGIQSLGIIRLKA